MRCKGFRFAGVACGIKAGGALDLGLMVSATPATTAAVFTQNRMAAAPVQLSKRVLSRRSTTCAIIVNSGNANACTGALGLADANRMQKQTAAQLGVSSSEVLVASTGVIGVPLPMQSVEPGISAAIDSAKATGFERFANAILTTDRRAKTARRTISVGGKRITMIGCTKGAGMIAPNMATTLTFVATDAAIADRPLEQALKLACSRSFNAITVDGDTSTNDMIAVLANGSSAVKITSKAAIRSFGDGLIDLLTELATELIGAGEGVHHVARVDVRGAVSDKAANAIARTIANSPLVKTAIAGRDPNWGRILCAAGNAGVAFKPSDVELDIGNIAVVRGGVAAPALGKNEPRVITVMAKPRYTIKLSVGSGPGHAHYLACDLSHEYVSINADYRS